MKNRLSVIALTVLFCCISMDATSAELIGKFTGSGSGETAEFEVEAPWLLDWRVNSDYPQMLGIEVSLIDAKIGTHAGYVLKTKYAGNGVRLFDEGGRYQLRVDATMTNWILKVMQLSREEAEQYTPREKSKLYD
jgi:hypothetical protein